MSKAMEAVLQFAPELSFLGSAVGPFAPFLGLWVPILDSSWVLESSGESQDVLLGTVSPSTGQPAEPLARPHGNLKTYCNNPSSFVRLSEKETSIPTVCTAPPSTPTSLTMQPPQSPKNTRNCVSSWNRRQAVIYQLHSGRVGLRLPGTSDLHWWLWCLHVLLEACSGLQERLVGSRVTM